MLNEKASWEFFYGLLCTISQLIIKIFSLKISCCRNIKILNNLKVTLFDLCPFENCPIICYKTPEFTEFAYFCYEYYQNPFWDNYALNNHCVSVRNPFTRSSLNEGHKSPQSLISATDFKSGHGHNRILSWWPTIVIIARNAIRTDSRSSIQLWNAKVHSGTLEPNVERAQLENFSESKSDWTRNKALCLFDRRTIPGTGHNEVLEGVDVPFPLSVRERHISYYMESFKQKWIKFVRTFWSLS